MKSKLRNISKLSKLRFFPTNVCFLMWSFEWRCKQINKKKTFFVIKISFERCLCVGNVSITHRGLFALLLFYGELLVIYRFLSNFACLYLGASHSGRPPVFRKQSILDMALMADIICLLKVTPMVSTFHQES